MSRNARPHYRPGLGWILGFAFEDTLARPVRLAQEFTLVRCHGSPRASSPHGLTATRYGRLTTAPSRAVASGSRLLPTRPAKDFHLQSSAHARHTFVAPLLAMTGGQTARNDIKGRPCVNVKQSSSKTPPLHAAIPDSPCSSICAIPPAEQTR